MAKSGKGRGKPPEPARSGRAQATFERTKHFDKELEKLGAVNVARVAAAIQQFEKEWARSKTDEDILPGFNLKQLESVKGKYRLCQIRATADYRATATFLIGAGQAYWLHVWKKSALNNRSDIESSKQRARDLWDSVQVQAHDQEGGKNKRTSRGKGKGGKA